MLGWQNQNPLCCFTITRTCTSHTSHPQQTLKQQTWLFLGFPGMEKINFWLPDTVPFLINTPDRRWSNLWSVRETQHHLKSSECEQWWFCELSSSLDTNTIKCITPTYLGKRLENYSLKGKDLINLTLQKKQIFANSKKHITAPRYRTALWQPVCIAITR